MTVLAKKHGQKEAEKRRITVYMLQLNSQHFTSFNRVSENALAYADCCLPEGRDRGPHPKNDDEFPRPIRIEKYFQCI